MTNMIKYYWIELLLTLVFTICVFIIVKHISGLIFNIALITILFGGIFLGLKFIVNSFKTKKTYFK